MTALAARLILAALLLCVACGAPAAPAAPGIVDPAAVTGGDAALDAEIGRCFSLRGSDPGAAIALARRLLARPMVPGDEIKVQSCRGRAEAIRGNGAAARDAVERIDALLAAHPMPSAFALRAASNAGAIRHVVGDIDGALSAYREALELARSDDAAEAEAATLLNLGIIQSEELGAFDAAEAFFRQADAIEVPGSEADALLPYNRARNRVRMGDTAQAVALFDEARGLAEANGARMIALRARAEGLALAPGDAPVVDTLQQLDAIAAELAGLSDISGAASVSTAMAVLALGQDLPARALSGADAALAMLGDSGFRRERIDALDTRIRALAALGRHDEALASSDALRAFEVGLLRGQSLSSLADLQARLSDADQRREMAALRRQDEDRGAALDATRLLRNGAILGFVLLALGTALFAIFQRRLRGRLETLSTVDPLTGLLNRRAASRRLDAISQPVRVPGGRCGALFLIDVDHFKQVNDLHGHGVGDRVLVDIAQRLAACCRPDDVIARWGGEEFLVACPRMDVEQARVIAERLRAAVAARPVAPRDGIEIPLAVSIGFACWPFFPARPGRVPAADAWQEAVVVADRALYAVKAAGRDGWLGLCGNDGVEADVGEVLRDPARHAADGRIQVVAARPDVPWPAEPVGGATAGMSPG